MSSTKDSTLVVIGSGPGIGSATASYFAQKGFDRVVLISRSPDRLREGCLAVEAAAQKAHRSVSVGTWAVDITDTSAYQEVLARVAEFGTLECLFFNAARVQPSQLLEETVEEMEYDFKVRYHTVHHYKIAAVLNGAAQVYP